MKMKYLVLTAVMVLLSGCMFLDKTIGNNDGDFDVPEIELSVTDASGVLYVAAYTEEGINLEGKFVDPGGNLWEIDNKGTVSVTNFRGDSFKIKLDNSQ